MNVSLKLYILVLLSLGFTSGCFPLPPGNLHSLENRANDLVSHAATKTDVIKELGDPPRYTTASMSYVGCPGAALLIGGMPPLWSTFELPRHQECFELVLMFNAQDQLIGYEKNPMEVEFDATKEDINLLELAVQGDDVALRLWERSSTYRSKLRFGIGMIKVDESVEDSSEKSWLVEYLNNLAPNNALEWLCRAADDGNAEARSQLGKLYYYGSQEYPQLENIQIDSNLPKACMWFHMAGWYGSAEVDRTARAMTSGEIEEGKKFFQEWSPGQCDADFEFFPGSGYPDGSDLARLCREADKGNHQAREDIARKYFFGSHGVERNLPRAYMWYRLAEAVYVSPEPRIAAMQTTCNAMTTEQATASEELFAGWKSGQCQLDVTRSIHGPSPIP